MQENSSRMEFSAQKFVVVNKFLVLKVLMGKHFDVTSAGGSVIIKLG